MIATLLASKFTIPIAAVLVTVALLFAVYHAGANAQKAKDQSAAMDLINKRDKINGKVNDYDAQQLCTSLGGSWVSNGCQ